MRKRKINETYLRQILAPDVRDEMIDASVFSATLGEFVGEYLCGIATLETSGDANGKVRLKLPVVSYLIRLLAEGIDEGETISFSITIDENLTLMASYPRLPCVDDTALIVKVARLAGFDVKRKGESLYFTAKMQTSAIMHVYASSSEEFMYYLVTTRKM